MNQSIHFFKKQRRQKPTVIVSVAFALFIFYDSFSFISSFTLSRSAPKNKVFERECLIQMIRSHQSYLQVIFLIQDVLPSHDIVQYLFVSNN
jgi:uncharacterized protein (DUF58 family)